MTYVKSAIAVYHELLTTEGVFSMSYILIGIIGVILWLGMASMASELAEQKGGNARNVFVFCMIFPVLAPFASMLYYSNKGVSQKVSGSSVESGKVVAEEGVAEEVMEETVESTDAVIIDQDYFVRKMDKYGPDHAYVIDSSDKSFKVTKILEALPGLLVCQIEDESGNLHRMRVPYAKITNVHY